MFDIVLYPVSAILWFWHNAFGAVLPRDAAWALAIVFLVVTIRALLIKPAISQLRAARRARELAPQMEKLRKKYAKDRQRLAREVQKLHAANGTSPLAGCLPALVQLPVFLSLYWVLRGFTPDAPSNQIFDRAGVESFLHADLFGAPLGTWISQDPTPAMIVVGGVLMLAAATATFLTMRMSVRTSQRKHTAASTELAAVSRVLLFLAPVGVVVSGAFFPVPIAVLLYFLTSNLWTLAQQHVLGAIVEREPLTR